MNLFEFGRQYRMAHDYFFALPPTMHTFGYNICIRMCPSSNTSNTQAILSTVLYIMQRERNMQKDAPLVIMSLHPGVIPQISLCNIKDKTAAYGVIVNALNDLIKTTKRGRSTLYCIHRDGLKSEEFNLNSKAMDLVLEVFEEAVTTILQ